MAGEIDHISRMLGNIESTVNNLERRFDKTDSRIERLEGRFEERGETIGKIGDSVADTVEGLRLLKESVAEMKPVTDEVKQWKMMGMGALGIIGIGGTAMGSAIMWLLSQLGWVKLPPT